MTIYRHWSFPLDVFWPENIGALAEEWQTTRVPHPIRNRSAGVK